MTGATTFVQQLIYGLSYGMNLAVAAAGLSLLFGVYRVVNLAHGQQIMLGGYTAYVVSTVLGAPYLVGLLAAMIMMGILGVILEYSVFRFLQNRPSTDQMLASLGLFMILGTIALRIWGDFEARSVHMPGRDLGDRIYGFKTRRVENFHRCDNPRSVWLALLYRLPDSFGSYDAGASAE